MTAEADFYLKLGFKGGLAVEYNSQQSREYSSAEQELNHEAATCVSAKLYVKPVAKLSFVAEVKVVRWTWRAEIWTPYEIAWEGNTASSVPPAGERSESQHYRFSLPPR